MVSAASRLKLFVNIEVPVGRFLSLLLDVLHDHFVSHVTRTGRKVHPSPQMPSPKRPTQILILHQHLPRGLSLHRLSQLADRNVGRSRHKNLHMILRDMPLEDLNVIGFTYLTDQISKPFRNLPSQNRLALFGDPHKMVFQVINGMARFAIVFHTASILKSSPKGEGFSPIPRGRQ